MRYTACTLTILLLCACAAFAADPPAAVPPPRGGHNVAIGPMDSLDSPRPVRGKLTVVAAVPREVTAAGVEFFLDDKLQGSSTTRPHRLSIDIAAVPDGEHLLKAVATDAGGSQVWAATTKILVDNTKKALPEPSEPGPAVVPEGPGPMPGPPDGPGGPRPPVEPNGAMLPPPDEPGVAPAPDGPDELRPGPRPPRPRPGVKEPPPANDPAAPSPTALDKTYSSAKHSVTLRFPGTWVVSDDTASKARGADVCWLTFGPAPLASARSTIAVHKQKIKATTDADTFARYNDYVLLWERKTINGRTAFVNRDSSAGTTTHRAIIIAPGAAWMFKCVDEGGTNAPVFDSMLESFVPEAL